jgi:hypothetical protein
MGGTVTKDAIKSWSWRFSGLHENFPPLGNPDIMLEGMKVFIIA